MPDVMSPFQSDLQLDYPDENGVRRSLRVSSALLIGRGRDCELQITHPLVSRHHLAVLLDKGRWWIRDLQSSNGTFVGDRPIETLELTGATTVRLGSDGPSLRMFPPSTSRESPSQQSLKEVSERYFQTDTGEDAGHHTMMIRQAFRQAKQRQRRVYVGLITMFVVLLIAVAGLALFQQLQLEKTRELAKETFYEMKELELHIANLEASIERDASVAVRQQIDESKRLLAGMRERYDTFVQEIQASRIVKLSSEDEIILHMARVFGETELDLPDDFVAEVKSYIRKWQATQRLARAIRRLNEHGYAQTIIRELQAQDLPPQFLYLALQESGFRDDAVGPRTRYGHAKGMWQFIPDTAKRYGLNPGPLQHLGRYDPNDDRHDVAKATRAAARYLKDIYRTDAQASGLLVMASYNWGEGNIIKRVRKLPENPKDRNFWTLLRDHRIPDETYNYVFYIFSAAVIGENPALFGFEFENPLLETISTTASKPGLYPPIP